MNEAHAYVSTACLHGLHGQCRQVCKFCDDPCECSGCDHSVLPEQGGMLAHYSRALDEIWRLRAVLAYEATVLDAARGYRTLPGGLRGPLDASAAAMRAAARGEPSSLGPDAAQMALRMAGAPELLTRGMWEDSHA